MNYNKRCYLIRDRKQVGYLGDDVIGGVEEKVCCYQGTLTQNEQLDFFGTFKQSALKLHIQGEHDNFSKVRYQGIERSITAKKYHRNSTVVVIE